MAVRAAIASSNSAFVFVNSYRRNSTSQKTATTNATKLDLDNIGNIGFRFRWEQSRFDSCCMVFFKKTHKLKKKQRERGKMRQTGTIRRSNAFICSSSNSRHFATCLCYRLYIPFVIWEMELELVCYIFYILLTAVRRVFSLRKSFIAAINRAIYQSNQNKQNDTYIYIVNVWFTRFVALVGESGDETCVFSGRSRNFASRTVQRTRLLVQMSTRPNVRYCYYLLKNWKSIYSIITIRAISLRWSFAAAFNRDDSVCASSAKFRCDWFEIFQK